MREHVLPPVTHLTSMPLYTPGSFSYSALLLNHTITSGATHAVLHHFWATGAQGKIDRIIVEYYIDGETTPSISMQPALMCGMAFPSRMNETYLYSGVAVR